MTKPEAKLVVALLREASEHYSNHGCNDLPDNVRGLLTDDEWRSLALKVLHASEPGDYADLEEVEHALNSDFGLMDAFADLIAVQHWIE